MIDFHGYEIVRVQFFNFVAVKSVTVSDRGIRFTSECVRRLSDTEYIEMLVHPFKKRLTVKPCTKANANAIRWVSRKKDVFYPRQINGKAFINTLFELFDWNHDFKYRFRGILKYINNIPIIDFDLNEPEMIRDKIIYFNNDWATGFGNDYYLKRIPINNNDHSIQSAYNTAPDIQPTVSEIRKEIIRNLMKEIQKPEE